MKKAILFLLLLCNNIPGKSQIIPDTVKSGKEYHTVLNKVADSDTLTLIEKVWLHIDRTYYFPGDDIWFKAYLIDAYDRQLSDHSSNLHVELISPFSEIIASRIIRLEGGLGNGDLKLADDLPTGKYLIRAYTNYMRNFTEELFFTKEIFVINSTDKKEEIPPDIKQIENKIRLSFFPEGGSLVDNVSSIVAFKAENSLGKGCEISGKIFSSNGKLITAFGSSHLGMGSFLLRPFPGLEYYALFKGADSVQSRTELAKSFPEGVTLSASISQNGDLLVTIKTNPVFFQQTSEDELLLTISLRKEIIKTVLCKTNSPTTSFIIPTDDVPEGILMLTLSDLDDNHLAERLVFIQRNAPVSLKIKSDKPFYTKREQVSLKIILPGDSATKRNANLSLAVVNKGLTENTSFQSNISSWFLLESDVRGQVEDPSYYFDPVNPNRVKDLDLLLRTQGWRDFAWKYDKTYFPPEKGFRISGRLRESSIKKPVEESRISIGIFGKNNSFLTTIPVDTTGRFKLSGIDITGDARLIITGIDEKERLHGEISLDSVSFLPPEFKDSRSSLAVLTNNNLSYLKTYFEVSESIKRKYRLSDTISLGEVKVISERHKDPQTVKIEDSRQKYTRPDSEVIITQQMQGYLYPIEILRGHVAGVTVINSFPDYKVIIRSLGSINAQGQPLVLIDGNEATFNNLLTMPISEIDRIDVLKSYATTSIFGFRGSSGVINLITKTVDSKYKPIEYSLNSKISGYNAARIFYSPQHSARSEISYNPDLRSTLLWEPNINLKADNEVILKYYNGDNSSIVRITSEGLTTDGIPVTGTTEYEIR